VYVDADFLLALLKQDDWLKPAAARLAEQYRGTLRTSESTFLEVLVVASRRGLQLPALVAEIHDLAPLDDANIAALAVRNMREHGMTPFDAFLAARAWREGQAVLSSDSAFEKVGVERVPLR
jgi:predicted nucleic acid-binding protein